jgi:hypothetical protein
VIRSFVICTLREVNLYRILASNSKGTISLGLLILNNKIKNEGWKNKVWGVNKWLRVPLMGLGMRELSN